VKRFLPYWQDKKMHKKVWQLSWPMILSNITIPLLGLVDTAVMGHLDSPIYMGAVAIGSVIIGTVIWACNFLRMGTTGFTSQALGRDNNPEIHAIIWRSLLAAFFIALLFIVFQNSFASAALGFIDGSPEVKSLAREYFDIRIWGLPASIGSFAIVGWFIGLHNTRIPLILLVVTNSLNIILDIIFVLVLDMNVAGAAYASLISVYVSIILGLYFIFAEFRKYPAHSNLKSIFNTTAVVKMFSVNRDIFIRTMALQLVFFMIAAEGAKLGNDVLAANAVLLNFLFLITNGLDGIAQAVEALVGKAIGAKDKYSFDSSIIVASGWSLLMSIVYLVVFFLTGEFIIGLITNIDSVRTTAYVYLPWLIFMPINGVWSYILDGIYIGATRGKELRDSMLIATFLVFIPAWYLLQPLGNHGIWLAFHIFMIARTIVLGISFRHLYRTHQFIPIKTL
jgi:MATE family multidrug resistance protein